MSSCPFGPFLHFVSKPSDLPHCEGVYVVRCGDSKSVYVGAASNLMRRLGAWHHPSPFVRARGGIQGVETPITQRQSGWSLEYWEMMETFERVSRHGIENTRGWKYTRSVLSYSELVGLRDVCVTLQDLCFKCGAPGHFASECVREDRERWLEEIDNMIEKRFEELIEKRRLGQPVASDVSSVPQVFVKCDPLEPDSPPSSQAAPASPTMPPPSPPASTPRLAFGTGAALAPDTPPRHARSSQAAPAGSGPRCLWQLHGSCVRCACTIKYNTSKPFCYDCFRIWNMHANPEFDEKFCHACGKSATTCFSSPECEACAPCAPM